MTSSLKKVHLIAVGGSVMHNMALALHHTGVIVTGSDDGFYEPSRSRLADAGILPSSTGWDVDKISTDLDAVIVGMHAKNDNPELSKAKELGLNIYSFPEFVYKYSEDKQRIVIAGSHGKTTITSMILHVFNYLNREFDFLVGAQIEGFDTMVQLSDAPIIIVEGDEYLNSVLDPVPKFFKYHHHIALISGIAWDHINVFPSFDGYVDQFRKLAHSTPKAGTIICNEEDELANEILKETPEEGDITKLTYTAHPHIIKNGKAFLVFDKKEIPVSFFGQHNFSNVSAAKSICSRLRVTDEQFYEAITYFKGANKRLETIYETPSNIAYQDFAHSPSKLKASSHAVKELFPNRTLIACVELNTFSSTNKDFLSEYKDTFNSPDQALVYLNPTVFENKGVTIFTEDELRTNFNRPDLLLFTSKEALEMHLNNLQWQNTNLLLMSSANFDNIDMKGIAQQLFD